ncbi:radical SAM domain containing protein [Tritrichomonas foetus]|uniref:Radical SAM domain containing protein n=1 Tax=Tritrichomonas foetus TaxID=1144522 RepID=A0A1J4J5N3_9EUKA|nr:radical SAM domain containing protein [Tritrichomonas foetus]|eukprot:OHS93977.1 radical SAM domain containing protein [Tritrichomonas foetus]
MLYTLRKPTRSLPSFSSSLKAALASEKLSHDQIVSLLQTTNPSEVEQLHCEADKLTRKIFGDYVSIRGIVEFSNTCEKACHYCGVPTYNDKFLIDQESILECCDFMYEKGYRNLVLQSGEVTTNERIEWVLELLHRVKTKFGSEKDTGMCVVLSIGELSRQQYQKLFDAGANRYLLRIESSDPELYASMHPKKNHSFERRLEALRDLKSIGYVTGTGVMVGVPNQTFDHLAHDIEFFRDEGYHMIGLGPYLIHNDTIMGRKLMKETTADERKEADQLKADITLNTYDVIRLTCPLVNIAATTALETLSAGYKKKALTGGANVLMPIITPKQFRSGYQLYEGKKEVDMDRLQTHEMMLNLMKTINKTPMFKRWNHPPLYTKTQSK